MRIIEKSVEESKYAIGLMSGTSLDGVDAALVKLKGTGTNLSVELVMFDSQPFSSALRTILLETVMGEAGGSRRICLLNALLGEVYKDACLALCKKSGISKEEISFVGSHGQTLYHAPIQEEIAGDFARGTLQVGEASILAEALGCPVVSDFRVRDMAAEGQGAPLVPYTEYLLYRQEDSCIALQNIGGIGNVTILPARGKEQDVVAFDTGPGNMVIDALVSYYTNGKQKYDDAGKLAAKGKVNFQLLDWMKLQDEEYLTAAPPKSTGREVYNEKYVEALLQQAEECAAEEKDVLATATHYTAECIALGIERFSPAPPTQLIVGGGGSHNETLLQSLSKLLSKTKVITQEQLGFSSDAKEAIAFAVLANETLYGHYNNLPSATGAKHPVIMGKISL